MEIRVVDYYDDEASLFSNTDEQSGGDGKEVSKFVVEAETVGKSKPDAHDEISPLKPGDVVREIFSLSFYLLVSFYSFNRFYQLYTISF